MYSNDIIATANNLKKVFPVKALEKAISRNKDLDVVKYLIEYSGYLVDVNLAKVAAQYNRADIIEYLFDNNHLDVGDVNRAAKNNINPLFDVAVEHASCDAIEILSCYFGWQPLYSGFINNVSPDQIDVDNFLICFSHFLQVWVKESDDLDEIFDYANSLALDVNNTTYNKEVFKTRYIQILERALEIANADIDLPVTRVMIWEHFRKVDPIAAFKANTSFLFRSKKLNDLEHFIFEEISSTDLSEMAATTWAELIIAKKISHAENKDSPISSLDDNLQRAIQAYYQVCHFKGEAAGNLTLQLHSILSGNHAHKNPPSEKTWLREAVTAYILYDLYMKNEKKMALPIIERFNSFFTNYTPTLFKPENHTSSTFKPVIKPELLKTDNGWR